MRKFSHGVSIKWCDKKYICPSAQLQGYNMELLKLDAWCPIMITEWLTVMNVLYTVHISLPYCTYARTYVRTYCTYTCKPNSYLYMKYSISYLFPSLYNLGKNHMYVCIFYFILINFIGLKLASKRLVTSL